VRLKKVRPSKPGSYWWMDINGKYRTVEFDDEMYTPVQTGGFFDVSTPEFEFFNPHGFEKKDDFKCWVGPANPPKRVKIRYESAFGAWTFTSGTVKKIVDYDDVKEFLISDEAMYPPKEDDGNVGLVE
jgi:hypothetical protein